MLNCKAEGPLPYNFKDCDLSNQSLAGKDLSGADFTNAKLEGTIFEGATSIKGAKFNKAKMGKGTNFKGLDLTEVIWGDSPDFGSDAGKPCNFTNAKISYSALGKRWSCLNLTRATVTGMPAMLRRLQVEHSNLTGIRLVNKKLPAAHFENTDLTDAVFTETDFENAVFDTGTVLLRTGFQKAILTGATFDRLNVFNADFTEAKLESASFLNARMDGCKFESTDVTASKFSNPPYFSQDVANIASLKNSKIRLETLGKNWSFLNLQNTNIVGLDPKADFSELRAEGSILTGWNFTDYHLAKAVFTSAKLDGVIFERAQLPGADFKRAQGTKTKFDGAVLDGATLSNIKTTEAGKEVLNASTFRGSSFKKASLLNVVLSGINLEAYKEGDTVYKCDFSEAAMDAAEMVQASVTDAKFAGVTLHGGILSRIVLKKVDFTGARMGKYSLLFLYNSKSQKEQYESFKRSLDGNDWTYIKDRFKDHGITLANPKVDKLRANYSWTITEGQTIYNVVNAKNIDDTFNLEICQTAKEAQLGEAILETVDFTGADIRGTAATQAFVSLDCTFAGTKLDEVNFSEANLFGVKLEKAVLYKSNFDGATLIEANLSGALLADSHFVGANLQGAKFTNTDLQSIPFGNAAMSVPVSGTGKNGVYMLRFADSETALVAELTSTATRLKPTSKDRLNEKKCSGLEYMDADPKLRFSDKATVEILVKDKEWIINDPDAVVPQAQKYRLWMGKNQLGRDVIWARRYDVSHLSDLFLSKLGITLDAYATLIKNEDGTYQLDNNPSDAGKTGDIGFLFVHTAGTWQLYATEAGMATRVAGKPVTLRQKFGATELCAGGSLCDPYTGNTYFGPDTICPNLKTYQNNKKDEIPWLEMLKRPKKGPGPAGK